MAIVLRLTINTLLAINGMLVWEIAFVVSTDSGLPTNSCAQVILSETIKNAPVWVVSPILQKVQLLQGLFLSLHSPWHSVILQCMQTAVTAEDKFL